MYQTNAFRASSKRLENSLALVNSKNESPNNYTQNDKQCDIINHQNMELTTETESTLMRRKINI